MRLITGPRRRHTGEGHAIVIGSSVAGLTTAAALAVHMDRVTVVERDRLPRGSGWRRGVAQARHAHSLMSAGRQGLETLFPGVTQELLEAGMVSVRMPEDMLMLGPGGWMPRFETDLTMMTGTRDLVDSVLRDRLWADPKVTFLAETEVTGLHPGRNDTVVGAWVRSRDPETESGWSRHRMIPAEFVVDASGRTSRVVDWLTELGYQAPPESVVDARTAWSTTVFEPPLDHVADWTCMLLTATPDTPRQGVLNPIEGGRWMVSLSAGGGVRPPMDHVGFVEFARTLRSPVLYEAIERALPVGPVYGCGRTENRWRHFEKLRRWPDGFLVIGDALAAFNPSYGQGMSVATHSALLLEDHLLRHGTVTGITFRLRRALAQQIRPAWQLAAGMDRHHPGAAEACPPGLVARLGRRCLDRVAAAAPTDLTAARVLLDLTQLIAPPHAVFRPGVLASALRGPRRPVPADPPSTTHGSGAERSTVRPATADGRPVLVPRQAARAGGQHEVTGP